MDTQVTIYESMCSLSGRMREAARENNWDQLCSLEHEVAGLRERLQQESGPASLDETSRQQKIRLIRQILADDREIRSHVDPWMDGVRQLLAGGARQRALHNAYGIPGR